MAPVVARVGRDAISLTPPLDLSLLPTDDLLEAIAQRYSTTIFAGLEERGDASVVYKTRYSGDRFQAMGLAQFLTHDLARETIADERDVD